MATSIDDKTAQKIFKAIEEQSDALKKIGCHLTKLEESKQKKPIHVETQMRMIEKIGMKEIRPNMKGTSNLRNSLRISWHEGKMDKMQLAFHKAQGMDDCLYNMGGMGSKTLIALPPKFKISNVEKFDGAGDPKQHVRRYQCIVEMKGLDEKQTLHAFLLSFTGGTSRWYYSLDPNKTKVWNELVELFVDQFIFNTMIVVTLRDLETTKQGVGETFSNT